MINSFKNFERLRYRISNDIKNLVIDNKSSNDNMREEISNTIFATIFSAFITEIAFSSNVETVEWCGIVISILIFIIVYVVSYRVYNWAHKKLELFWGIRKLQTVDKSMDAMIQIQKDFDNIACDSILVARDFKIAFEKLEKDEENGDSGEDKNLKAFYLFETMHYLGTACEKTKDLVQNRQKCIRTLDESEGVDIFRVKNIISIIQELDVFLDNKLGVLVDYEDQREAINFQHKRIKELIDKIKEYM